MKTLRYLMLTMAMMAAVSSSAKQGTVKHVYIFGFSASFQDSLVYLTPIQDIRDSAWVDSKTKFLMGRDNYSYQLRNYFNEKQQPARVCMVFYALKKKKAEKLYMKVKHKYTKPRKQKRRKVKAPQMYDLRYLTAQEFHFEPVDMSAEQEVPMTRAERKAAKAAAKQKAKAAKKSAKEAKKRAKESRKKARADKKKKK